MDVKNKKIVVVGLAKSGIASANLLFDLGADVYITDSNEDEYVKWNCRKLRSNLIKTQVGIHSKDFLKDASLIVISPGVPSNSKVLDFAKELNVPVIGEIELAYRFCKGTIIAITGTNGKTTVTTLISKVLQSSGRRVFLLGNIGIPFSQAVLEINEDDYVCLEVSSFQLESIVHFRPKVSVFLNFSCDHLDRYSNISEYLEAKKRIFMNQIKDDYAVLNYYDPALREAAGKIKAKTLYFNSPETLLKFKNRQPLNPNEQAVCAVADIFRIDLDDCMNEFLEFKGIEHRMEFVRNTRGIDFINDSKATNIDSTVWAINNIKKPIVLIAGGRDKGRDYRDIKDALGKKVKKIIVIGEARKKIKDALDKFVKVEESETLKEAVNIGLNSANAGEVILLSPMCSSFDMFKNYQDRGDKFKQIVNKID